MVREHGGGDIPVDDVGDQSVPLLWMGSDLIPFASAETGWLPQHGLGDSELADVVELGTEIGMVGVRG